MKVIPVTVLLHHAEGIEWGWGQKFVSRQRIAILHQPKGSCKDHGEHCKFQVVYIS